MLVLLEESTILSPFSLIIKLYPKPSNVETDKAVSYTHLDVYKRQSQYNQSLLKDSYFVKYI